MEWEWTTGPGLDPFFVAAAAALESARENIGMDAPTPNPEPTDHITPEQRDHIRRTRIAEAQGFLDRWDGTGGDWYFLSFANAGPGGFLGCAIVKAPSAETAPLVAHRRGCNPGGEAQFGRVPELPGITEALFHPAYTNRLLTRAEVDELDAKANAAGHA
jgi:hypothetical protein